jgi:hypothetical protein
MLDAKRDLLARFTSSIPNQPGRATVRAGPATVRADQPGLATVCTGIPPRSIS